MTNRELYLEVTALAKQARQSSRSLEEYLRALLALAGNYKEVQHLSATEFLGILSQALSTDPLPFHSAWAEKYETKLKSNGCFAEWEATAQQQAVDLREMAEAGVFANNMRYFGLSAPRGGYWFNFDIGTYLECAMAGTYGGWEPGDCSGRQLVPGEVAVLEADGSITAKDPASLSEPVKTIDHVSWKDFIHFLRCGQFYE